MDKIETKDVGVITPQRLRQAARRELARRHLPDFSRYLNPRLSMEGFHLSYYRLLEMFGRGEVRRLMVSMPPQHGKSLGSSVMLPLWMLGRDPSLRIAIASYNTRLASRFNRQIASSLSSARYGELFPASALGKGRQTGYVRTDEQIDIPGYPGGTFAVGREGTLTGNAVDIAILDDLYKDAMEAYSPTVRENCWEWYTSVVRTRLHNRSQELVVFTRWHEEDLVGRLSACEQIVELTDWAQLDTLPEDAWVHLRLEAIKESPPTQIDPRNRGEALWEMRHGLPLLEAKRRLDPVRFEALYQGRPSSAEGYLYGNRIQTYDVLPADQDVVERGNYTDTADTGDDYLCSVCYVVGRDGLAYVTDVVYSRDPMEVTEGLVAEMLLGERTCIARIEANNGGRGFARAVERLAGGVAIETFHQSAGKEARILSTSPQLLQKLRMPRDWAIRWPELHIHLTTYRRRYGANRWHDAPDALTGLVERLCGVAAFKRRIKAVRFSG